MNPNNDSGSGLDEEYDFMDNQPKHTYLMLFILLVFLCVGLIGLFIQNATIAALCAAGDIAVSLLWMIS